MLVTSIKWAVEVLEKDSRSDGGRICREKAKELTRCYIKISPFLSDIDSINLSFKGDSRPHGEHV